MRKTWALATIAAIGAAAPALAATETFNFSGACTDCFVGQGNGTGQLILQDYSYGQEITQGNFVSFHYDGSDLYPSFTLNNDSVFDVSGMISGPGPAAADFYAYDANNYFDSTRQGFWQLGSQSDVLDYGVSHTFTAQPAVSAAPEPAAWALMIAGVGIAGTAMRRRQRTTVRYA